MVAEEGKRLKTQGVIEANLTIGKLALKWEVYVAPIRDEVLLGCDVIDEYNITINTKRGIKVDGTWIGGEVVRKSDKIARVFVKESVTVPANSEIIIEGTGKQAEYIDTRYASLEPFYDDFCYMNNTDEGAEVCSNNNHGLLLLSLRFTWIRLFQRYMKIGKVVQ